MADKFVVRSSRRLAFLGLCLGTALLVHGCDAGVTATPGSRSGAPRAAAQQLGGDEVLVVIDGREVTLADLQDAIGNQLGQMDFQYRSQRHRVIEQAMQRYVRDQLLEAEANARGVTVDELTADVLGDRVNVSDDDVRLFYVQNQAQLAGRTFESIAGQIRDYLESQIRESVLEEFTDGLAEGRSIEYVFEPLRVDIDITGAPAAGREDAPVTIVEFSDFQCPYCKSFNPTLEQVKQAYGDDLRVVFKHFPLRDIHAQAQIAAEASMCAHEQGKFWEAHDLYFAEQDRLQEADLREKAGRLGLDEAAFGACLSSGRYVGLIDGDVSDGIVVGVNGTPAVFINGRPLPGGAVPFEMVAELIDDELERIRR